MTAEEARRITKSGSSSELSKLYDEIKIAANSGKEQIFISGDTSKYVINELRDSGFKVEADAQNLFVGQRPLIVSWK